MNHPKITHAFVLALFLGMSAASFAQYTSGSRDVLTPNTGTWNAAGVSLNNTQFVNLGLQGVGRFAANSIDAATGETLGSISDMQISNWQFNGSNNWSGTFNFLPDRGYNAGSTFSNYAARINTFDFSFTPHTSSANAPGQNQIAMNFTGSTRFTYDHDNNPLTAPVFTTGLVANGTATVFGDTAPIVTGTTTLNGVTVSNRLTLDSEGLILDNRAGKAGSGWVGDEYGANIYHFNSSKQIDGTLKLPAALVPHSSSGGPINFQTDPPADGRRINQGMEGIAQSPDGKKVFGLLQSATVQDSGSGNQNRANAVRLVVYDVNGNDTPNDPVAQYVIQLPRIDDNGGTPAVNRAGAQSSIIALNDHQILILSRDGNGRGSAGAPVFKSVLLADLRGATNIDGMFDAAGNFVTTTAGSGVLSPSITPMTWTEALNMLGKLDLATTELAQFGLNLNAGPGDLNTISEKWEAMGLVPTNDGNPNDYFLFIGNDNDFQTANTRMFDAAGNLQTYTNTLENDNMVLAFRVQVIPEPVTVGFGIALAGVTLLRRRRGSAVRA